MFNPFRQEEDEHLDTAIASVYSDLHSMNADDPAYAVAVKQLAPLYALKNKRTVDPDTLLIVAGNLVTAIMVLQFEKTGVVTSKVLSFLTKR